MFTTKIRALADWSVSAGPKWVSAKEGKVSEDPVRISVREWMGFGSPKVHLGNGLDGSQEAETWVSARDGRI